MAKAPKPERPRIFRNIDAAATTAEQLMAIGLQPTTGDDVDLISEWIGHVSRREQFRQEHEALVDLHISNVQVRNRLSDLLTAVDGEVANAVLALGVAVGLRMRSL